MYILSKTKEMTRTSLPDSHKHKKGKKTESGHEKIYFIVCYLTRNSLQDNRQPDLFQLCHAGLTAD